MVGFFFNVTSSAILLDFYRFKKSLNVSRNVRTSIILLADRVHIGKRSYL